MPVNLRTGLNSISEFDLPPHIRARLKSGNSVNIASSGQTVSQLNSIVAGEEIKEGEPIHITADGVAILADSNNFVCNAIAASNAVLHGTLYFTLEKIVNTDITLRKGEIIYLGTTEKRLVQYVPDSNFTQIIGIATDTNKYLPFINVAEYYK